MPLPSPHSPLASRGRSPKELPVLGPLCPFQAWVRAENWAGEKPDLPEPRVNPLNQAPLQASIPRLRISRYLPKLHHPSRAEDRSVITWVSSLLDKGYNFLLPPLRFLLSPLHLCLGTRLQKSSHLPNWFLEKNKFYKIEIIFSSLCVSVSVIHRALLEQDPDQVPSGWI